MLLSIGYADRCRGSPVTGTWVASVPGTWLWFSRTMGVPVTLGGPNVTGTVGELIKLIAYSALCRIFKCRSRGIGGYTKPQNNRLTKRQLPIMMVGQLLTRHRIDLD